MKLHALTALFLSAAALSSAGGAGAEPEQQQRRHHHLAVKRQAPAAAPGAPSGSASNSGSTSPSPSPSTPSPSSPSLSPAAPTGAPQSASGQAGSVSVSGSAVSTSVTIPTPVVSVPPGTNGVPALSLISFGMSSGVPSPVVSTYAAGATPPVPGAPPLPAPFVFNAADWPAQDKIPDTNSPEVQQWMQELEGFDIPEWPPTVDGTCAGDPAAAAQASDRGWWPCGRHTRDTDITACPTKLDWGVSFDDGPSPYSEQLLNYLDKQNIKATFFVVGSRVLERPQVLIEEYMAGHEISLHTWSHHSLTAMTTEQIVAEFGWTRKVIQRVLGITPTSMRPPYGDIDDRVRAIALAMGMVPILWTGTPSGTFDTNDWRVGAGQVDATTSFNIFEGILGNATSLNTGFIVLQHDLFEVSVDLAVGYTLNAALSHQPAFSLKPIGVCSNIPPGNLYAESNKNTSFPYTNHTVITSANSNTTTDSGSGSTSSTQSTNSAADGRVSVSWLVAGLIGGGFATAHWLFY